MFMYFLSLILIFVPPAVATGFIYSLYTGRFSKRRGCLIGFVCGTFSIPLVYSGCIFFDGPIAGWIVIPIAGILATWGICHLMQRPRTWHHRDGEEIA